MNSSIAVCVVNDLLRHVKTKEAKLPLCNLYTNPPGKLLERRSSRQSRKSIARVLLPTGKARLPVREKSFINLGPPRALLGDRACGPNRRRLPHNRSAETRLMKTSAN
ncbi:hypothetical protein CDAR_586521 [Caerostris darwini]|uniref:Uncharacterized protein n=1 Tax=Caerostris darwini TaxID=1538125 RepID=A0AAV4Q842_9ARAC|nr:hypothetical protein CDAR_586521 [Caerostris darwini]